MTSPGEGSPAQGDSPLRWSSPRSVSGSVGGSRFPSCLVLPVTNALGHDLIMRRCNGIMQSPAELVTLEDFML